MSQKRQESGNQQKQEKPKSGQIEQVGPDQLPLAGLTEDFNSVAGLPDHRTTRSLRRAAVLQIQRRHGNAYVQRMLSSEQWPVRQRHPPGENILQRVLGPPYPFQGIITTRWNAALRRTPSRRGRLIANLDRNTRVTAISNSGNWLEVRTTINGSIETGYVSQELVSNIPAAGAAPALGRGGRQEVTDFGTYNVYPNRRRGRLQPNELYQAEFERLQTAWRRVNDNSGGLITNGSATDVAAMRRMLGGFMAHSQTFRNLIVEITEDAANPVTINVGRNNAYWVDEFSTNRVDLSDIAYFDPSPRPGYEWAETQGEIVIHWLAERRHSAAQGGGFAPAHAAPLAAGGVQEQYRADIGQTGRIVSQVRHGPAGGVHTGVYTDDSGNIQRIRRDGSGGNPVVYEISYEPAGGGAIATRRNNIVAEVRSTRARSQKLYLKFTDAAHDVSSPTANVAAGSPLNFTTRFGRIVPAGASVRVELYKDRTLFPDSRLGTTTWNHPFTDHTDVITAGGVDYTVTVRLVMEP